MLPEVRMARVWDTIASHRAGRLSYVEAGELVAFSERHFRRLRDAFEERGEDGLIDRRRERVTARAADEAEAAGMAEMFRTRQFALWFENLREQIVGLPMVSVKPRWVYQRRRQRQLDATDRHAICGDGRSRPLNEHLQRSLHSAKRVGDSIEASCWP